MDAELFVAADMYDLAKLRSICEAVLRSKIDEENAADLLLLAYLQVPRVFKVRKKLRLYWRESVEFHHLSVRICILDIVGFQIFETCLVCIPTLTCIPDLIVQVSDLLDEHIVMKVLMCCELLKGARLLMDTERI